MVAVKNLRTSSSMRIGSGPARSTVPLRGSAFATLASAWATSSDTMGCIMAGGNRTDVPRWPIGQCAHELEELCGANDCVGNREASISASWMNFAENNRLPAAAPCTTDRRVMMPHGGGCLGRQEIALLLSRRTPLRAGPRMRVSWRRQKRLALPFNASDSPSPVTVLMPDERDAASTCGLADEGCQRVWPRSARYRRSPQSS